MTTNRLDKALEKIAQDELRIETLEQRMMDSLDFHEVSVWELKAALMAAYKLGTQEGTAHAE